MEELNLADRPGFFERLFGRHRFSEYDEFEEIDQDYDSAGHLRADASPLYTVRIRRQVVAFDDAVSAADGLKRGDQQILNLSSADPSLRERIKDFLAGVNYAHDGTWEEIGENVYLLAPNSALVETAPPSPRISAIHN